MTAQKDTLNVETPMDLLIVLLYSPGQDGSPNAPIDGITRLQKLIFLLQQGIGPKTLVEEAKEYNYVPFKMGPFSEGLRDDLEELISAGIVTTERLHYWLSDDSDDPADIDPDFDIPLRKRKVLESTRYSLSSTIGERVGDELLHSLTAKQRAELSEFKEFFNSLSLRQLLIFTYERFPEFTERSTIKEQLGF